MLFIYPHIIQEELDVYKNKDALSHVYFTFVTMDKFTKYNFIEVKELYAALTKRRIAIMEEVEMLNSKIKYLYSILTENESNSRNWVILLPDEFGQNIPREPLKKEIDKPLQWKSTVIRMLSKYEMPMTSDLLYHKIKQEQRLPYERRFIIKNISSALFSLYQENKIFREKVVGKRDYLYGFSYCFDIQGKLRSDYLKKYKLESYG